MQNLINQILPSFSDGPTVSSIALCGSVGKKNNDEISDIDIFVFHRQEQPLSEHFIANSFPIEGAAIKHKAFDVEQNYLLEGRIVNVKHFSIAFLFSYANRPLQWDDMSLEQVENIATMQILTDRDGHVTACQNSLRHDFSRQKERLGKEMIDHYGNLMWRSVYQGVYRDEALSCYMMLTECAMLLAKLCYVKSDLFPAPLKWRFSSKYLDKLPGGEGVKRIIAALAKVDYEDKSQRIAYYGCVKHFELDIVMPFLGPERTAWWWDVFSPERARSAKADAAVLTMLRKNGLALDPHGSTHATPD